MYQGYVTKDERWYFYRGKKLPSLYVEYLNYLHSVKGLSGESICNYKKFVLRFLMKFPQYSVASRVNGLKPALVHDHVTETAQSLKRSGKNYLVTSLRAFFRFLHLNGYTKKDLSKSVPTLISYRLSSLHRGVSWKIVQKMLELPDRRTHSGRRDFAILLMLATYGVRQRQLIKLRMKDVDWKKETIVFHAMKGGKDISVPLLPDVAKALIAYFKGGRNKAEKKYDHVFLTTGRGGSYSSGQRPMGKTFWKVISQNLKRLGIDSTSNIPRGAHSIRHAFATNLLSKNTPIKTISDLLGHSSIRTTFIYTKSDIKRLRTLTEDWPNSEAV